MPNAGIYLKQSPQYIYFVGINIFNSVEKFETQLKLLQRVGYSP